MENEETGLSCLNRREFYCTRILILLVILIVRLSSATQPTATATSAAPYQEGTVYITGGDVKLVKGVLDKSGAAYGYYNDSLEETGWGTLEIKAGYNNQTDNKNIMYAAGYLEGAFTAQRIWQHYQNMWDFFLKGKDPNVEKKVRQFMTEQDTWARQMVAKHAGADPYWRHVSYILAQLDGLYDGYKYAADQAWETDMFVVQLLNGVGDLIDLMKVVSESERPDFSVMSKEMIRDYIHRHTHCSALVKITGAYENLYMSHSSWFTYSATMRIYKIYNFNINDPATATTVSAFSSYPGFLESLDDFYEMDSGLVLLQTTNNVFNNSLYDKVKPTSMLAWQRVRIANMMAHSGKEWSNNFALYNSGTYNNQYMVVDLKQVELGKILHDGILWVIEQIPGLVIERDQTKILREGYWPSYNVPFYDMIYNLSGYPDFVKEHGLEYSYQLAPRAKIFRRDQATVVDMDTMKNIMRYNNYKNDSYTDGNPCNTICCRGDLETPGQADGCYDTKVCDYSMAGNLQAYIINGPTLTDNLPPFSWTGEFESLPHRGLPDSYAFPWLTIEPTL